MGSKFNSKAECLQGISRSVSVFQVPLLMTFSVLEFYQRSTEFLDKIARYFDEGMIAVRSSAGDEDGDTASAAGMYTSLLNIPANDSGAVSAAIELVIDSYRQRRECGQRDQVIVQEMVSAPSLSGVIFTHELNTGAPYYVINYDDCSGMTNTVTAGDGEYANRTLYVHRGSLRAVRSERFKVLLEAVQELEVIMGSQFLDIEFAMGADLTPYLLQVREITTLPNWNRALSKKIDSYLMGIRTFLTQRFKRASGVFGETTVLSQMSDWNPAEIIGRAPRALSFSLYQKLITNAAWLEARKAMGYATPYGQPLMVSLAGQPFIDTRLSFHSYLPAGLSQYTAEKLVNVWVERLSTQPELHDKIEFDVAITTYSFDIDSRIDVLIGDKLSSEQVAEFKALLHTQAQTLISTQQGSSLAQAMEAIDYLDVRQNEFLISAADESMSSCLLSIIHDCIKLGTTPFSILARHGFIAKILLSSMQCCGVLSVEDVNNFQASIHTVASDLVDDMYELDMGNMSIGDILSRYGHLRPGTYDILSLRYDQMEEFGRDSGGKIHKRDICHFVLSEQKKQQVNQLLAEHQFSHLGADGFFEYCRQAIVGREYGKFIFTKSVSIILELIADFGNLHGLSREEMSHVPLQALLSIATESIDCGIEEYLRDISQRNCEKHAFSIAIRLPQVLFDLEGVHVVPFQVSHPNFITNRKVTAPKEFIDSHTCSKGLFGKVVMIENADPGFDWIFAQNIVGLVTKFGGANSHMAIRCAEFSIPAAIGCGEQRFEALLKGKYILLDATSGLVKSMD
jgi:glutamine kinase